MIAVLFQNPEDEPIFNTIAQSYFTLKEVIQVAFAHGFSSSFL